MVQLRDTLCFFGANLQITNMPIALQKKRCCDKLSLETQAKSAAKYIAKLAQNEG